MIILSSPSSGLLLRKFENRKLPSSQQQQSKLRRHLRSFSIIILVQEEQSKIKWSFTNYVNKTRQVGGTGKINDMQIFLHKSRGIPSLISTGGTQVLRQVVNIGKNLVNIVKERPLASQQCSTWPTFCKEKKTIWRKRNEDGEKSI